MYVKVHATPGAKKELFLPVPLSACSAQAGRWTSGQTGEKEKEGYFKIAVKERAQKNAANKRIITLVARHFKVPEGKVRIVNGHHHPSKLMFVDI